MGWKSSYVINDSKANYFNVLNSGTEPDYGKTNFFLYKENINAAYLNLNRPLSEKWTIQAGLRFENTNYSGRQYGNPTRSDSAFNRSYNGLFPTAYLSYAANKQNQFALSAGRRVDRPAYENLNPFLYFIDRYTYGRGNPYLKPQYTNNIELTHIFNGKVTTTLNYSYTKDLFAQTYDQAGQYASVQSNGNIGHSESMGISVSTQLSAGKWFSTNIYTNYNYKKTDGVVFGEPLRVNGGNFNANVTNQFNIDKGWNLELGGWYNSKLFFGQMILKSMGAINAGVSRQVLKGKGTIKFDVRDMFYTQPVYGEINFKTTRLTFYQAEDSRVGTLTFTYRFGKPLTVPEKKRRLNEEQSRVKGGQ